MTAHRMQSANQGFALVDVLVALAVTGLAGSILVGLLGFIERSAYQTRELAQIDRGIASVHRLLHQMTEEPYFVRAAGASAAVPYGTKRAFVIASTGPRILGLSRPARFQLECEITGEETRILLRWTDPDTGREHTEVAAAALDHASFSYFGRHGTSAERSWQPEWQDKSSRLEAVKLTLHSRGMPIPVELVAPLRADLAMQCTRNPHQPGCQVRED